MAYTTLPATADASKGLAVDLISTSYYQRIKVSFGDAGVAVDVSATNALPTTDAGLTPIGTKLDQLHADLTTAPSSIPAGANLIGKVGLQANGVDVSTAAPLPVVTAAASVLFAPISAATLGASNTLVAAVAGKSIRVVGFALVCSVANTVTFFNGATALTGAMSFATNGGLSAPQSTAGLFQTSANTDLKVTLGVAGQVSGWLVYQLV